MNRQKIIIFIFSLMVFISSCRQDQNIGCNNTYINKTADSTISVRFILREKFICKINPDIDRISDSLIHGYWKENLSWELEDSCWYGLEPVDLKTSLTLYKSKKFIWQETASDPKYNYCEQGEYWTFSRNDSCFLVLATNNNSDTTFIHEDTIYTQKFHVYSLSDNRLKIRRLTNYGASENIIYEFLK